MFFLHGHVALGALFYYASQVGNIPASALALFSSQQGLACLHADSYALITEHPETFMVGGGLTYVYRRAGRISTVSHALVLSHLKRVIDLLDKYSL